MALYSFTCPDCRTSTSIQVPIRHYDPDTHRPVCDCGVSMLRDYRADAPQPAPMWPEHFNPSSGTVVRTERQLADDLKRKDEALFERTGIEQRSVVVSAADSKLD